MMTQIRRYRDELKIREATPLPAIGSQVALWVYAKPPLFVGIFTVVDPEKELKEETWHGHVQIDIGLIGHNIYATEYLGRNGGCDFFFNMVLSDRYDASTTFPTIYRVVGICTEDSLISLDNDEVLHQLLVLLQDAGDLRYA